MSEIARLRKQIELECQSMKQALYGYAVIASHDAINHKYDTIGRYQEQLEQLVGEQEAAEIVCDLYAEIVG
jgi:hypothetical protein